MPASKPTPVVLQVAGREITVTNPGKVYFPEAGITKIEVVQYYLSVAEGALRGAGGRPNVLVRYANGIHGEFFYQKRAPDKRPEWLEVAELREHVPEETRPAAEPLDPDDVPRWSGPPRE